MKKCVLMLVLILLNSSIFGQFGKNNTGKITVRETDGSPSATQIDTVEVNNGSLTVSGNTATINITAAAASSADSIAREDGVIDGDSLMTKTRTDTVTGAKVFIGDVTLPDNCVTSDQIVTNAVGSLEIAGSSVKESEINWAEVSDDSVVSRLANKIDSTHVVNGSLTNSDLKSGTIQSSRLATGAVTETKLATSSVTETKIKWSSVNADSAFSSVSAKVATQISDSLGRYTTNSLLDTTKADTSQWGKFVRDHQSSGGTAGGDSLFDTITLGSDARNVDGVVNFVASDGDTSSIRAKTDGTLNLYATKGIGIRMPKSDATYPFLVTNEANGGVGDSTGLSMNSTGQIGIKGAPNSSYSLYVNSGESYLPTIRGSTYALSGNSSYTFSGSDININLHTFGNVLNISNTTGLLYYTKNVQFRGDFTVGNSTVADQQSPDLIIYNDAGSRSGVVTTEAFTISCTANIDSTKARWNLNDTQAWGIQTNSAFTCADTFRTGNYTTYTYIIPGGDPVKSSNADLKHNFTPLDSVLHPWELFGKAEALEIFQFQYDSAKVYEKSKFDSTIYAWWNEKPADSLSLGQKDSVSAELAKRKLDTKKNWETEQKEFASKVSKPVHTGPTEAAWNSFMYSDQYKKGINSGDVMWAQMALIKKLVAEVKRLDGITKDLEARVSKLEGN